MWVCGFGDEALALDSAIHHPSPRATGGRDFSGSGDQLVRPTLRPRRLSPVIATQPRSLMVVRKGQVGEMAVRRTPWTPRSPK